MSLTKLEPCPFCGSGKIKFSYIRDGQSLGCASCSAAVHAYEPSSGDKCVEKWNKRFSLTRAASPEPEPIEGTTCRHKVHGEPCGDDASSPVHTDTMCSYYHKFKPAEPIEGTKESKEGRTDLLMDEPFLTPRAFVNTVELLKANVEVIP